MDERNDMDKADEVILPGFRFHPTDEELVGFYLKRKVQQKPLSIELIRQLNIYKYDPWDLPKLATTGEKEWYFYCPRDRKYRNSARPNRVTSAGFWKATGTDRPIYSSEGTKCIGLKKSLVFYKGRAAKGMKTDWMMHEFRLPSASDPSLPKRPIDKNIPANDSWAICRIFKKTNSMAQRTAFSHSWVSSPLPVSSTTTDSTMFPIPCSTTDSMPTIQFSNNHHHSTTISNCNPTWNVAMPPPLISVSNPEIPTSTCFMFSGGAGELSAPPKCGGADAVASMLLNMAPAIFGDAQRLPTSIDFGQQHNHHQQQQQQQQQSFTIEYPTSDANLSRGRGEEEFWVRKSGTGTALHGSYSTIMSFPFGVSQQHDDQHPTWDHHHSCPSEIIPTSNSSQCYT